MFSSFTLKKSRKVYSISYGEYSEYSINSIFSSREKAEEYMKTNNMNPLYYRIEIFDFDPEISDIAKELKQKNQFIFEMSVLYVEGKDISRLYSPHIEKISTERVDEEYLKDLSEIKAHMYAYRAGRKAPPELHTNYKLKVIADSEEHALKIWTEKIRQVICNSNL